MVQHGGTQISGVKLTACIISFHDLLHGSSSSEQSRKWWSDFNTKAPDSSPITVDGKLCLIRLATWLERFCNKQIWHKLTLASAMASAKDLVSACASISILRYAGLDGRLAELMLYRVALLCYSLPWQARNEVVKWCLQQIFDRLPMLHAPDLICSDDPALQYPFKRCRASVIRIVEVSDIVLQLAKALNAHGDVIDRTDLKNVRKLMKAVEQLGLILPHPSTLR